MDFSSFSAASSVSTATILPTSGTDDEGFFPRPAPRPPRSSTTTTTLDNTNAACETTKEDNNNNNNNNEAAASAAAVDESSLSTTQLLLEAVNDHLEHELSETKTTVQRILQQLVALHTVSVQVHGQWTPVQEAEHEEEARLNELQSDVHGSVGVLNVDLPQQQQQQHS